VRVGWVPVPGGAVCHTPSPVLPDCYRCITVYGELFGTLRDANPVPSGVNDIREAP